MLENEVLTVIKERRSIREFLPKVIDDEVLNTILEAGLYAPSAAGRQSPIFVVTKNSATNQKLGEINFSILQSIMDKRPAVDANAPALEPTAKQSSFYQAPVVISIFAPKDWYNFTIDCAVAAENMMLAAQSLGVSSCMIARAKETFETKAGLEFKKAWGIQDDCEGKIHVLLGYSNDFETKAKPRKTERIITIE